MSILQSFVAVVGKTATRVHVETDPSGEVFIALLDGTPVVDFPEIAMTAAHLRSAMEQREIKTGKRSSLLTTSTVGLPNHVWKVTEPTLELIRRNPWGFSDAKVAKVIAGLTETYGLETVEQAA
jgi:hypothetical protein